MRVAALGIDVAESLELAEDEKRAFVAACLLHDVGHFPLSHAAEPAFARVVGVDHHQMSAWILLGEGGIAKDDSLYPELQKAGIDHALVWAFIEGGKGLSGRAEQLGALLRAPINLDTLDGIVRVAQDFRVRKPKLAGELFTWEGEELAIRHDALDSADLFWKLKDRVYERIINLPSNILAEARLCELVARKVSEDVLSQFMKYTDRSLIEDLGESYERVCIDQVDDRDYELRSHAAWGDILVRMRKRYFIDERDHEAGENLPLSRWKLRFRHQREAAYLVSKRKQLDLPLCGPMLTMESPEI